MNYRTIQSDDCSMIVVGFIAIPTFCMYPVVGLVEVNPLDPTYIIDPISSRHWTTTVGAGMTIPVYSGIGAGKGSYITINSGTTVDSTTILESNYFFQLSTGFRLSVGLSSSTRIINQDLYLELVECDSTGKVITATTRDTYTAQLGARSGVYFRFTGATVTKANYGIRGCSMAEDSAEIADCPSLVEASATVGTTATLGTSPDFTQTTNYEISGDTTRLILVTRTVDSTSSPTLVKYNNRTRLNPRGYYKLRIRCVNGSTAPASSVAWYIFQVYIADNLSHSAVNNGVADLSKEITAVALTSQTMTMAISGSYAAVPYYYDSVASVAPTLVNASARNLMFLQASNSSASAVWVKIYDKSTAPVVASDIPKFKFLVPAGASVQVDLPTVGVVLSTGLGFVLTGGVGNTDATAPAVGTVLNLGYRTS